MLWSITHSPTPRYLSIHLAISLFSPEALSVLKLGLGVPDGGGVRCSYVLGSRLRNHGGLTGRDTHVKPVERFIPARKAETEERLASEDAVIYRLRMFLHSTASKA